MSFGWSTGDIAIAIRLIYEVTNALDSSNGAAGDYRDTVLFLKDLKRTLEPLQCFTASDVPSAYRKDITEQVDHLKQPISEFLQTVAKFDSSLGHNAKKGRQHHVFKKLEWYMRVSKKAQALKEKIKTHMRIIDMLMLRLTL